MDAVPVIARGHNVAVFVPPVPDAAVPLVHAVARRPLLVLSADADAAVRLAEATGPQVFPVTGLERARRRLAPAPQTVAVGVEDALALMERSALRPAAFPSVLLAWPEQFHAAALAALEAIMTDADREAQRIVVTGAPGPALERLIERYAFKAMTYGFPPTERSEGWQPPAPLGAARYVIGRPVQLADLRRRILDHLQPDDDASVVTAPCPASREEARALAERAGGDGPVLVLAPEQLGWARELFRPLVPLPVGAAIRGRLERRADALREQLARMVTEDDLTRELLLLGPLLERFDAAELAAAALRLVAEPARAAPATPPADVPAYTRLWVGCGRKDGARPADLVAALANEGRVPAAAIGRIELRDLFALVEIRAEHAEQAVRGLTGSTIRGRRIVARVDRGPGGRRATSPGSPPA